VKIGLYFDGALPVRRYGGTERVIVWLARGLRELGHEPVILAREGTILPPFPVRELSTATIRQMAGDPSFILDPCLPDDLDVVHFHTPVAGRLDRPHITTIHGNGEPGSFGPAHVFVSRDHMRRMQGRHFVYNGIDPDDYVYRREKDDHMLFLGLASRRVKGVDRAIRIAKLGNRRLLIAGGRGLSLDRRIRWGGLVDNARKRELLARSCVLLNPIRWQEPFGLVVVEALVSGTPVLASPLGAMPELVTRDVGALCEADEEFAEAIGRVGQWDPEACRKRVLDGFTHTIMAGSYFALYQRAAAGTLAD
jgi:glycosyltransferase involved in cell wall biosynthesis